jgi:hypothetical protein
MAGLLLRDDLLAPLALPRQRGQGGLFRGRGKIEFMLAFAIG